jgi:predicted O-methyltransferase YrrM
MAGELLAAALSRYLEELVPPRPAELAAMEASAREARFPIVGPAAGQFCYLVARMIGARRIFEMGSGFGYSTAWFARAVKENGGGSVYHVVWDEGLSQRARVHLRALGLDSVVEYRVGEAVQTLRDTPGEFDLIFNDIDKHAYPSSLPVVAAKLRPGGVLIVDNMLWHARIFDGADHSATTEGVRKLTRRLVTDPRWITSLVPIRDGLLIAYRQPR